ncbi:uncharacterized protein LOC123527729 [Mercenaria mercenaria]|uniref:uncharacterized protein LOC123527729 n=1 Tax=Mercenaria mercenaria TaxID=6596 RepID=UPI00234EA99B|nr:uncharacterized protein LOC123527729 [Mercenaria mercenaria]
MKPTQTAEKTLSQKESLKTEMGEKLFRRKIVCMFTGVVAFVLLVGTVLLSVYFGMKMTKDIHKEYQAIYIIDEGIVHQNITVTDTEEIFTNDVATIIVDFSTGLITTHFKKPEKYVNNCYVTNLSNRDSQTPTEFTSTHSTSQVKFENKNITTITYTVIDIWLNNKALGQRSAELCNGKIPFFLRERRDLTTRAKRFDLEDNATTYRATRDAYLKAENELKLETGSYKAARDAYVAATATYTKSLYE